MTITTSYSARASKVRTGADQRIVDRAQKFVDIHAQDVFLRREFRCLGSTRQVSRALSALVDSGVMVKLGVGIYAKAKKSVLTGKAIPVKPLEVLAPIALAKLGVTVSEGPMTKLYNSGVSKQVPAGVVFDIGTRRVTRKIGFNGKFVKLVRIKP